MSDGTTVLFGLPGAEVREVARVAAGRVAQVVTADPDAAACPVCGVFAQVVRQRHPPPQFKTKCLLICDSIGEASPARSS